MEKLDPKSNDEFVTRLESLDCNRESDGHGVNDDKTNMWLVIEWKLQSKHLHDGYSLISAEDLTDNLSVQDFHTGKVVNVNTPSGIKPACIVIVSNDKHFLEMELKHLQEAVRQIGSSKKPTTTPSNKKVVKQKPKNNPKVIEENSDEDFTASASDWTPSAEDDSEVEIATKNKQKRRMSQSGAKKRKTKGRKKEIKMQQEEHVQERLTPKLNNGAPHLYKRHSEPMVYNTPPANSYAMESRQYQTIVEHVPTPIPPPPIMYNHSRQRNNFQSPASNMDYSLKAPPMTFDQQTQTSLSNPDHSLALVQENQKLMGDDIAFLHKVIDEMGHKIQNLQEMLEQVQYNQRCEENRPMTRNSNVQEANSYLLPHDPIPNPAVLRSTNGNTTMNPEPYENSDPYKFTSNSPTQQKSPPQRPHPQPPVHPMNRFPVDVPEAPVIRIDGTDMVALGSGMTLVPKHIYHQVKWTSYSYATRKLLMAVFPRRTLATHSLTGKSSPAFNDKPAKMKLDARKVTDIIMTVSQMCNIPENLVRNTITTKCADENKMYRMRLAKRKNKKPSTNSENENEENESP